MVVPERAAAASASAPGSSVDTDLPLPKVLSASFSASVLGTNSLAVSLSIFLSVITCAIAASSTLSSIIGILALAATFAGDILVSALKTLAIELASSFTPLTIASVSGRM